MINQAGPQPAPSVSHLIIGRVSGKLACYILIETALLALPFRSRCAEDVLVRVPLIFSLCLLRLYSPPSYPSTHFVITAVVANSGECNDAQYLVLVRELLLELLLFLGPRIRSGRVEVEGDAGR